MLEFITANLATILICAVLAVVVGLVIRSMAKDKKSGKTSCGCGCSGCAMKDQCHKNKQ